ncbi:MAG TPA: hypothetical protein VLS28_10240 [Candidatus Sulfomarinibacteraceae bacterium]|nr:hypothetical protein [Candidatus Sulfomarinibacteraceae bacterium]
MSRTIRLAALLAAVATIAIVAGFIAAVAALAILEAVLPPFTPADDETLRELVPAVLAYAAWGATTLATFRVAWRRVRRRIGLNS